MIDTGLELPFLSLPVKEHIGTIAHLPLDAQGAYMRLVLYQWMHQSIPGHDPQAITNILGVGARDAARLFRQVGPLFELRTVTGDWQSGQWVKLRADAERRARASRAKAITANRARWDASSKKQNAPRNAPSTPPSTLFPASGIPPSTGKNAPSTPSHNLEPSTSNDHQGGVVRSQEKNVEPTPPPPSGTLIKRNESVNWANDTAKIHARHHSEVCSWSNGRESKSGICMPSAMVLELAAKLVGVPQDAAVARVIAWANADQPPEGYVVPSDLFKHWRGRWDATMVATPQAPPVASSVPDLDAARRQKYFGTPEGWP